MLPDHRKASMKLLETGHAVPINDANREKRVSLGLDEIPPTVHSHKDALDELKIIMKRTGFKDLIERQEAEK